MERRQFIKNLGAGAVAGAGLAVTSPVAHAKAEYRWKMVTSWPKNYPGLGTGANFLAKLIGEMSGGRISIKVYGAGELVPAMQVFDVVSQGTVEMGHSGPFYWKGKHPATQFFSTVPFGMTCREMLGWLYHGGGLDLWTELYAKFNLVPAPCGNTGVQMAGWYNKKIETTDDLKGLKIRMPGLGGEVISRAGATSVLLPGSQLFTALQTGTIDATEWVGPYNDLAFGFHNVAKYYYYPGWHEPNSTLECIINKTAFDALPDDLQSIVTNACRVATQDMIAEYTTRDKDALIEIESKPGVEILKLPDSVLALLKKLSEEVVEEVASQNPFSRRVYDSYRAYQIKVTHWHDLAERSYILARS